MAGDGLSRGLSDMWRSVVVFLPVALAFVAILIIGYLLARLARAVTRKALRRVGFDRAVQRGPAARMFDGGAPSATEVCARIAFFVVLLLALQVAFGLWGPNPVSDLITALVRWLPQVVVGIVIVVVAAAVAGAAHDLIVAALGGLGYARVLAKAVAAVIVTLGVIAGLDQVGIATSVTRPLLITVLATVAGVIIVGVGGGLIRPMQQRWEGWLDRAATESAVIREQARAYTEERARIAAEDEARRAAEEARKAEEARLADEARLAEEARRAEEERLAEEKRLAEEARVAREASLAEERRAAQARQAEQERRAEEERRAAEVRRAEALWADEGRAEKRKADGSRSGEQPADETQVIALPGLGDHPTEVFGVNGGRAAPGDGDTTAVVGAGDGLVVTRGAGEQESTLVRLPGPDATVVIDADGERTQTVPLPPFEETQAIDPEDERRGRA